MRYDITGSESAFASRAFEDLRGGGLELAKLGIRLDPWFTGLRVRHGSV
jgi:hypothetical protein